MLLISHIKGLLSRSLVVLALGVMLLQQSAAQAQAEAPLPITSPSVPAAPGSFCIW